VQWEHIFQHVIEVAGVQTASGDQIEEALCGGFAVGDIFCADELFALSADGYGVSYSVLVAFLVQYVCERGVMPCTEYQNRGHGSVSLNCRNAVDVNMEDSLTTIFIIPQLIIEQHPSLSTNDRFLMKQNRISDSLSQ
jgi:hypothetical protein